MPKRATARPNTRRPAPYQSRNLNTSQSSSMAVTVAVPWDPMQAHHHGYLPPQTHSHYGPYEHPMLLQEYPPMPAAISAAPPVQHVRAPTYTDIHPHGQYNSSSNTGSGPWTPEMDEILIENHKRMKWDQIAEKFFNNTKTGNACRKRFARVISERKEPSRWPPERVQNVIEAYKRGDVRERMWRILAEEVGESWEHVERLCLNQGLKAMTSNKDETFGHVRSRSQALSHRSHRSINSDCEQHDGYDDEPPTDDSGLGGEVNGTDMLRVQPPHVYTNGTYETTGYNNGNYHRYS